MTIATISTMTGSTVLTAGECDDLVRHEQPIKTGLQNFVEVGAALLEISDRRLYRGTHSTFEDYCRETWAMSARRAYQLCDAARVVNDLPENVKNFTQTESHAFELAKVPAKKRAAVIAAVQTKSKTTGRKPTAKDIREAANTAIEKQDGALPTMFKAAHMGRKATERWWYGNAKPEARGVFILFLLNIGNKKVAVSDKANLKKCFLRWFDECVEDAKPPTLPSQ